MSSFTQSSPDVEIREIDLTNLPGTAGASGGAYTGDFVWGPVEEVTTVSSPIELQEIFGKPNDENFVDWFSCFNFLSYTGELKIVRVVDEDAINADDTGSGILIKNRQHFEIVNGSSPASFFASRYPGELGNSIGVYLADSSTFENWEYKDAFDFAPGTSTHAESVGAVNDEVHVIVIDRLGLFTGVVGGVLEVYPFLSKAVDAVGSNNEKNYYINVLNRSSRYIWALNVPSGADLVSPGVGVESITVDNGGTDYAAMTQVVFSDPDLPGGEHPTATIIADSGVIQQILVTNPGSGYINPPTVTIQSDTGSGATATATLQTDDSVDWGTNLVQNGAGVTFKNMAAEMNYPLSGGQNSTAVAAQEIIAGLEYFKNQEEVDVSLLFLGDAGGDDEHRAVVQHAIDQIAEFRRDLLVFFSPKLSDVLNQTQSQVVTNVIATRNAVGRSTSFAVMDSGWKFQYDVFNDKYRWIPLNADIAGLCAQVDSTNDPWTSPGGYTRGRIRNVVSLAFNPNKASRDALYKVGINPVVTFNTDGTVLYGDKTLLGKNSAFSQIGVRRLFILLQKTISDAAKYFLFETNNTFTRTAFVNMVEPYLEEVRGRGGVDDIRVVCDETNNGPQVVMNRQFVGDIYIKPNYSINWIQLNFVAVRQDVAFEEIIGGTF